MPRGHKSKLRAQEKRLQARCDNHLAQGAQDPGAQGGVGLSYSGPSGEADPSSSVPLLFLRTEDPPSPSRATDVSTRKRSEKGSKIIKKEMAPSAMVTVPNKSSEKELLVKKAGMLMRYLLYKYQMKEKAVKAEMFKILHKRFRPQFPEILQIISEWAELFFGLELKEVKCGGSCYTLVEKFNESSYGNLMSLLGAHMSGLLIAVPSVNFLSGNCAPEEEILKFLSGMAVDDEKEHLICGELQNLTTKNLMQKNYLMFRKAFESDTPCYEFLCSSRSHNEISKMKILEFLAKVNDTVPTAFPYHYAEALKEEEERAQASAACSHEAAALSLPGPGEISDTPVP